MSNLIDTSARSLGTELRIGPLGYGCWRLDNMPAADAQARIEAALESGMNLIDTADVYGLDWGGTAFGSAETLLGEVLAAAPGLRDQMVLASKGGIIPGVPYDSAYLAQACENSLRRLGVEQLDLYQVHRPDLLNHPQETARVLEDLKQAGKVREIGVSNYRPSQTRALMACLAGDLASQQPEYSAAHLDPLFDGTFDLCMEAGQTALVWSPLAGGSLASGDGVPPTLVQALDALAERKGVDRATLALAFSLAHPARPVALVGSIDPDRIRQATRALSVELDRGEVYAIIQASMGEPLP